MWRIGISASARRRKAATRSAAANWPRGYARCCAREPEALDRSVAVAGKIHAARERHARPALLPVAHTGRSQRLARVGLRRPHVVGVVIPTGLACGARI